MMKYLLPLVLSAILSYPLYGQEDSAKGHLEVGLTSSVGISMLLNGVPEDLSNLPYPAISVGALGVIHSLEDDDFSIVIGASYDVRAFMLKDTFTSSSQTIRACYFSVQAGFQWQRFYMLASLGLPLSARQTIEPDSILHTTEQNPDPIFIASGDMGGEQNFFMDLRIGALIPVMYSGNNHLDVVVQGTFGMLGLDGFTSISLLNFDRIEGPFYHVSALIGVAYFFSL